MNIASKEMKKKDENKKFTEKVKGKSISADETKKETAQKKINFNNKDNAVPNTPDSVKQEKKMVDKADYQKNVGNDSSNHKFLGINYHEYHIDELQQKAQELDLDGRSKMNKEELIVALYENHTAEEIYDVASEAEISGRSKMSKSQLINELRKRTVNKQKSSSKTTSSQSPASSNSTSKNSSAREFYKLTKEELYDEAKKKDIDGRSKMDKEDLLEALYKDHTREELYNKAKKEDIKGRSSMSKKELIRELQKA